MEKYHIPTAEYNTITTKEEAINYVEQCKIPIVLKKMDLQPVKV